MSNRPQDESSGPRKHASEGSPRQVYGPGGFPAESRPSSGYGSLSAMGDVDDDTRARNIILLGVVLLLGFLLPVLAPGRSDTEIVMLNIKILGEDHVGSLIKILAIYPLAAGIVTIVLGAACRNVGRGIALAAMGALPCLLILADEDFGDFAESLARQMPAAFGFSAVLAPIGMMGLFVGSRVMFYRPGLRTGGIIACSAAALWLLAQLIPVPMPGVGEKAPIAVPFEIWDDKIVALCLGLVGQLCCMIAAATIGIVGVFRTRSHRTLGAWAFGLMVASVACLAGGILVQILASMDDMPGKMMLAFASGLTKMAFWIGGMMLVLPVGLSDMVVSLLKPAGPLPGAHPTPEPHARMTQLKALKDAGLISDAEYERKKDEILDQL